MRRFVLFALLLLALSAGILWVVAGRASAPAITIQGPKKMVGLETRLDVSVTTPGGQLSRLEVALEQAGVVVPLFRLDDPNAAPLVQEAVDRVRLSRPIGRNALPSLKEGPLAVVVTAARPGLLGLRQSTATRRLDLAARFTPPRVSVTSNGHFVNHGGSELVAFRVSPADAESGVRVGDLLYPSFPASGLRGDITDPGLRVAFFALLHDQDLGTKVEVFARDGAGNESRAPVDAKYFPRRFRRGRIELSDAFFDRVLPDILAADRSIGAEKPGEGRLALFLRVNREMRAANAATIAALATRTSPEALWAGPFEPLGNSKVESSFADNRTYYYEGSEVDRQVHLGFDLAATVHVPVLAGNSGVVVHAGYLGIYGNTVVVDHGMGLQSLYAHLSSIDVKAGDKVGRGQPMGRSGTTGMAGGDHLHFAMLVNGHPVSPVEWWDAHWIEDRVLRKIAELGR